MNGRESLSDEVQEWLQELESNDPERVFAVVSLAVVVKTELILIKQLGSAGTNPEASIIVGEFLRILPRDKDPNIRSRIAKELGEIGHSITKVDHPVQTTLGIMERGLIKALDDENPKVRKAAEKSLRKIGTSTALAAVPPKPWWKFW